MKKLIIAAILVLCLSGCGTDADTASAPDNTVADDTSVVSTAQPQTENAALSDVFASIKSEVTLPDMVELNDNLLDRYYGLSTEDVADYAGGVDSSGVGQDEIVIMKAADDSKVETIRQALQTRYDSKLEQQKNYNPDEAAKIEKCEVKVIGSYVTLVISNDAAAIDGIISGYIG